MNNIQIAALNDSIARSINLANRYKDEDAELVKIFADLLKEEVIIKAKLAIGEELGRFEAMHLEAVVNQFKKEVAEA